MIDPLATIEALTPLLQLPAPVGALLRGLLDAAGGALGDGWRTVDAVVPFPARLLMIPPITGIIGYMTNWVAIRLLFHPVEFRGVEVPGLAKLATHMPRKIQQIPGVMEGKLGWQGIVPSRGAKMGSIAYDNSIEKIASQREFYEQLDPAAVSSFIVTRGKRDIFALVDRIIGREHPEMWGDAPDRVRDLVFDHVERRLPDVTQHLFDRTGDHIDDLSDVKMMIIRHLEENPRLLNRMFLEVGDRELKFLVNSGLIFGTLLGAFSIPIFLYVDAWWVLPVAGAGVGYMTNWIAIKAIFRPVHPHRIGPFNVQGLFIKRQDESVDTYASIVANEILTVENLGDHMLTGPKSDRTRKMIRDSLRPEIDRAVGVAEPLVRAVTGDRRYEAIRESLAREPIDQAMTLLGDPELNRERAERMEEMIAREMKSLPPEEYVQMLRPAFEEDEWLLIGVGAVLGFVAGWIQLLVVTAV